MSEDKTILPDASPAPASPKKSIKPLSAALIGSASALVLSAIIIGILAAVDLVNFGKPVTPEATPEKDNAQSSQEKPEKTEEPDNKTPEGDKQTKPEAQPANPTPEAKPFAKNPQLSLDQKYKAESGRVYKNLSYKSTNDYLKYEHITAVIDSGDRSIIHLSYSQDYYKGQGWGNQKNIDLKAPAKIKQLGYSRGPAVMAFTLVALLEDGRLASINDSDFVERGTSTLTLIDGPKDVTFLRQSTAVYDNGNFSGECVLAFTKEGLYYDAFQYIGN